MTNNDILRRLRYTFDFSDEKMVELFGLAGEEVSIQDVLDWMKKDDDEEQKELYDKTLAYFLNGLIIDKRGRKEGPLPTAEKSLSNNLIFRKLKIALNMRDDDILHVFDLVDLQVSKHEISALFRKPTQSQYRKCKDQFLRNFLRGLQVKYRNH